MFRLCEECKVTYRPFEVMDEDAGGNVYMAFEGLQCPGCHDIVESEDMTKEEWEFLEKGEY